MKKKEWVYREVLTAFLASKRTEFTQLALSRKLGISLSTVNNALCPLERMGAVEAKRMGFALTDWRKLLAYWASERELQKDIIYSTRCDMDVSRIEKTMPSGTVYTAYSGCKFLFSDVPADYGEVYAYADTEVAKKIEEMHPYAKGPANLFVLKKDGMMNAEKWVAPLPQLYVDLWNLPQWYAKEFVLALERRFE